MLYHVTYVTRQSERNPYHSPRYLIIVKKLKNETGRHVWIVGGGKLLQSFIQARLVDELFLQIVPVMIRSAIPLFSPADLESRFSLQEVHQSKQVAEMHFILKEENH
ncbi:dihydrofolate reductase family protein [Bacillus zhangzhouensis]|nr:dihydrofolate reductase family protein [Bacillus zhangzhouensis]